MAGIEVQPRLFAIVEADPEHRQRLRISAVVIVRIVRIEPDGICNRRSRHRRLGCSKHGVVREVREQTVLRRRDADDRQHAVSLAYVVPVTGTCEPRQDALEVTWMSPAEAASDALSAEMEGGRGVLLRRALAAVGALP